jgi:sulfide dehydrogenase cytochrome subunit
MIMKKILYCAVIAGSVLAIPFASAADASGQAIGFTCAGCHGTDGESQGIVPSLKGEDEKNLRLKLMDYKADARKGTIMNRIAKGYSDEEIAAVAKYFANLK